MNAQLIDMTRMLSVDRGWLIELSDEQMAAIRPLLQALEVAKDPSFFDEDRDYIIDALERRVKLAVQSLMFRHSQRD